MKNFLYWLFFSLVPLGAVAWLSNFLLGPAIFRMNDDAIINKLATLETNFSTNALAVHTSISYAEILNNLSNIYPTIAWNGILQIACSIFALSILNFFIATEKSIPLQIKITLIFLTYIYLFWYAAKPTFTMTAISLGIIGLMLLLASFQQQTNSVRIAYFASGLAVQLTSVLIRADGYYLSIILGVPILVYFLIFLSPLKKNFAFIAVNSLLMVTVVLLEANLLEKNLAESRAWAKFYTFHDEFFKIKTNPAETEMYKLIEAGKINSLEWDNVDAYILNSYAFYDQSVFSSENLAIGTAEVTDSLGFAGLKKRGLSYTFERTMSFLEESKFLFYGYLLMLLIAFFVKMAIWKRLLVFIIGFAPLVSVFFYLGGASRLPLRVHLPVIVFVFIFWLLLLALTVKRNQRILSWVMASTIIIFSSNFLFFNNNIFMVKAENAKITSNLSISQNTMTNINPNGIFIGQIMAFSESATFAYRKMSDSEVSYLTSGWHTFSPPWYEDLYALNLIQDSPYLALAGQPGVYWVSDLYTAQVLDMYMNNHEIIRKNLCLLADLPYGLGVFTFQSEQVCF
jgi:hypothetical protein